MKSRTSGQILQKKAAASRALSFVRSGMTLGLGTGSTAKIFLELLAERIRTEGINVCGVATSSSTALYAKNLNIPLTKIERVNKIDLVVDGADEFDKNLNMIKGGGGALLQEKIIASHSNHMIVITDSSKEVSRLGDFPLPVELVKFGCNLTKARISRILFELGFNEFEASFRKAGNELYVTDEGNYILDLSLENIADVIELENSLSKCPGVIETGLFIGLADTIIVGQTNGTSTLIGTEVVS